MEMKNIVELQITDSAKIAEARRLSANAAEQLGLNEIRTGKISIVASELCTNLLKHTTHGGLFFFRYYDTGPDCLEILTIDKGKGIGNIHESLRDGYSTAGTSGNGLGAVKRLSDELDIFSDGNGTVISSKFYLKPNNLYYDYSAINVPKKGEDSCGDKWKISFTKDRILMLVVDGLGHGIQASDAGYAAIKAFEENVHSDLPTIIANMHLRMKHTRGAAVAISEINPVENILKYCGIGNISGTTINGFDYKAMISHNGIAGHEIRKIQTFNYPWNENSVLIMHSDGLSAKWMNEKYPGLYNKSASVIAGVLYRDFTRHNDDSTVVVLKKKRLLDAAD